MSSLGQCFAISIGNFPEGQVHTFNSEYEAALSLTDANFLIRQLQFQGTALLSDQYRSLGTVPVHCQVVNLDSYVDQIEGTVFEDDELLL